MVALTVFKVASVLGFLSTFVNAAPSQKFACSDFRITSPTTYFNSTDGQCYQVSYDFGANPPSKRADITVDLYEYGTNKFINNLVKEQANGISTSWFNMDLGNYHKTGDYYYSVKYGDCKPIKTTRFHVNWNKNSPPAQCNN